MVRSINTLTLKRYSQFERTGKLKYLLYFPMPGYKKRVQELIDLIGVNLNGAEEVANKSRSQFHKAKSVYKIYLLYVLFDAIRASYVYLGAVNMARIEEGLEPIKSDSLDSYLKLVKKESGIDIAGPEDLGKVNNKIQHLEDKYKENFREDAKIEGQTFTELMISVFLILKIPVQYDLMLSDFFQLKEQADEIAKKYGEDQRNN